MEPEIVFRHSRMRLLGTHIKIFLILLNFTTETDELLPVVRENIRFHIFILIVASRFKWKTYANINKLDKHSCRRIFLSFSVEFSIRFSRYHMLDGRQRQQNKFLIFAKYLCAVDIKGLATLDVFVFKQDCLRV